MKQLTIAFIVIVSLLQGICVHAENIASSWAGGTGTQEDPYQISSVEHINKLRADSDADITYDEQKVYIK